MMAKAQCWISREAGLRLDLVDVELPGVDDHGVRVELRSTGICHSQLNQMKAPKVIPRTLGHEGLGEVVEVGRKVRALAKGDQVLLTWLEDFRTDQRRPEAFPLTLADGTEVAMSSCATWATEIVVDEKFVLRLNEKQASHPGVCLVGCAVPTGAGAATRVADVQTHDNVVVVGVGGVGACAVVGAVSRGANQVLAVDIDDSKLELATALGATATVNPLNGDPVAWVRSAMRREGGFNPGADVVLDCVGTEKTLRQAIECARPGRSGVHTGGRIIQVGMGQELALLPVKEMAVTGRALIPATAGGCRISDLLEFADWCYDGTLDLDVLVSKQVAFSDLPEAVEQLDKGLIRGRSIALMG
ncbi:zinc-binding dehydrogenase [Streptomyces sp. CA-100214]